MTLKQTCMAGALVGAVVASAVLAAGVPSALAQTVGVTLESNSAPMTRGCFALEADGGYAFQAHLSVPVLLPDGGTLTHEVDTGAIEVGNPPFLQAIQTAAQNRLQF